MQVFGKKCNIVKVDINTSLGDILCISGAAKILSKYGVSIEQEECCVENENEEQILQAHYQYMPLRGRLIQLDDSQIEDLLADIRALL